mmetsp:Transcript_4216/g.6043  ORF Transcript_4216/g.6043 Transcript_4216/m.6043 type:complete len:351 (+) Transcript_4216:2290-3342(+)
MSKLLQYLMVILVALASLSYQVSGFAPIIDNISHIHTNRDVIHKYRPSRIVGSKLNLFCQEQQLAFWITAFSTSHIGMSAVRDRLINICGELADKANLVDRGIKLPSYWLGDGFGKNEIFPDVDTAGRQIYRFLYTAVSFTTLGNTLISYLQSDKMGGIALSEQTYNILFGIASISYAASIASLFNASPMSLVPSFEKNENDSESSASIAGIRRNDAYKLEPKGLTRISRHPLILPVVPWGLSTSYLAGGTTSDFLLFGGLALYAIAGCACQDLRIIRKEGSVGTVMRTSRDIGTSLENFYMNTSFIPFAAVADGRQSMNVLVKELPIIPLIVGIPIGILIQDKLLQLLA